MPYKFNPFTGDLDYYESGGGSSVSMVFQPDSGTSPTLGATDTLTLTSADSSVGISGSSTTKTLNFKSQGQRPTVVTGSDSSYTAYSGALTATSTVVTSWFFLKGAAGANSNVSINNGSFVGQRAVILAGDDTATLTFSTGGNIKVNGTIVMTADSMLELVWTGNYWLQVNNAIGN